MPFYKDTSDHIHFLSDQDILEGGESFLPPGCFAISNEEAQTIISFKSKPQRLSERAAQYSSDMESLQKQWLSAAVADGMDEMSRKVDIETEIADTKAQYLADLAAIRSS